MNRILGLCLCMALFSPICPVGDVTPVASPAPKDDVTPRYEAETGGNENMVSPSPQPDPPPVPDTATGQ